MKEVAARHLLAVHDGLKHQRGIAAAAIGDLTDVAKVLEHPHHRPQNRRGDRLALIGRERHRAGEHHIVGQQSRDGLLVTRLDGLTEPLHATPLLVIKVSNRL